MTPAKTWVDNQWNTGSLESQVSRENFVRAIQADMVEHVVSLARGEITKTDWLMLCALLNKELLNLPSAPPKPD